MKFKARIETPTPDETVRAIDRAGILRIGPAMAGWGSDPEAWMMLPSLTAVVEAADASEAEARLRAAVGPLVSVGPVEPWASVLAVS